MLNQSITCRDLPLSNSSHSQCPYRMANQNQLFSNKRALQRCATVLLIYIFFATGVVIARSISFWVFLFDSISLKYRISRDDINFFFQEWGFHVMILIVFFQEQIKRKYNYTHLIPSCLLTDKQCRWSALVLVATTTTLRAFFLPLSESNC